MNAYCLAVIGAGQAAVPIIEKAKQMSIRVLAFARQGSYAQDMVDTFIEENSFDINFMAEKCREYGVNGIMATSELTTEVAARLAHSLSLPGNDVENGFAGKNKYVMRSRVSALSTVSQPAYELYGPGREYHYPVVIKPTDACGKRGVSIAFDESELLPLVDVAAANSTDGDVLVEEYLAGGKEYSIECLSFDGKHQVVQYTEKESSGPPHFVETAHHQPAALSDETKQRISVAVDDILSVLGLNCGMAHIELKIIDDRLFFIEVGARGGGDHIADILTVRSTDFDYFRAAIECSFGIYKPVESHSIAYTGIYFHCRQNRHLHRLFERAESAEWCIANTITSNRYPNAETNVDAADSGFIIYRSDHRITLADA